MASAPATAEKRPNKVTVTDIGPCAKKISIEIPAQTVAEHLGTSLDTLLTETELPGFRKGRAPRRLVEKKFGTTIRREAKNQLVAQAFNEAVEETKLKVIGDASSEMLKGLEITDGKPLSFDIEVEVLPEFELPSLDGIEVKKPVLEVTDDMINKEVERLVINEGRLEEKTDPQAGDYLTGHAVMKDSDGKTHLDLQDAVIQIPAEGKGPKGMILGVMVDDFADQLGKPKIGSTITIKTEGSENHENEAIRGKKLVVSFTTKRADQIIPAEIAEVCTRYGLENEQALRETIRQRIEQRLGIEQQSLMRQQIAKHLVESTKMEMPQRATAQQALRNLERIRLDMMYRGFDLQKIEETLAERRGSTGEAAVRELKLFFTLNKAADALDIKVSDAEINSRIAQIAQQRGERPEKLRQDIIARNQVGNVYGQIREHKTLDAVLAKAKVTEVSVEEFNKTFGKGDGPDSGGDDKAAEAKEEKKPAKSKSKKKSDE